jgi:para-aminobenzoate synthetase/4-amino-4-deoxychorismate lyase
MVKKISPTLNDLFPADRSEPFVFLETGRCNQENNRSFLFNRPLHILTLEPGGSAERFFKALIRYQKKGYWLAGYFSYELGYLLEDKLKNDLPPASGRLAWLGVFEKPLIVRHRFSFQESPADAGSKKEYRVLNARPNINATEYCKALQKIKNYLEGGDTYQVNYTFRINADFRGDIRALYRALRISQPTAFTSLINTGSSHILSFSPELFFRIKNNRIITRPMKGTSPRGRFPAEDHEYARLLKQSQKNRAENVMIVDLLRNDLGRVARKGSVKATKLFTLETYPTVLQMTSTIEGIIRKGIDFATLIKAIFPCGSVTGAPKIRTMQIIRELEHTPRGVYAGAIGYISPRNESCFSVAIRTLEVNNNNHITMGVGGGIVYDSSARREYREALLKAKFFLRPAGNITLIETIFWSKQSGFYLLDLHLKRLNNSCGYFMIPFSRSAIIKKIFALQKDFNPGLQYKIRLLINYRQNITVESSPLNTLPTVLKVMISSACVNRANPFLYHKTTRRAFYDRHFAMAKRRGFDEVIFTNRQGELTEGTFTTIFIEKDSRLLTPSLDCGLLPGVLREHLIKTKAAREAVLYPCDLGKAQRIYLGNSLRGLIPAKLAVKTLMNGSAPAEPKCVESSR